MGIHPSVDNRDTVGYERMIGRAPGALDGYGGRGVDGAVEREGADALERRNVVGIVEVGVDLRQVAK